MQSESAMGRLCPAAVLAAHLCSRPACVLCKLKFCGQRRVRFAVHILTFASHARMSTADNKEADEADDGGQSDVAGGLANDDATDDDIHLLGENGRDTWAASSPMATTSRAGGEIDRFEVDEQTLETRRFYTIGTPVNWAEEDATSTPPNLATLLPPAENCKVPEVAAAQDKRRKPPLLGVGRALRCCEVAGWIAHLQYLNGVLKLRLLRGFVWSLFVQIDLHQQRLDPFLIAQLLNRSFETYTLPRTTWLFPIPCDDCGSILHILQRVILTRRAPGALLNLIYVTLCRSVGAKARLTLFLPPSEVVAGSRDFKASVSRPIPTSVRLRVLRALLPRVRIKKPTAVCGAFWADGARLAAEVFWAPARRWVPVDFAERDAFFDFTRWDTALRSNADYEQLADSSVCVASRGNAQVRRGRRFECGSAAVSPRNSLVRESPPDLSGGNEASETAPVLPECGITPRGSAEPKCTRPSKFKFLISAASSDEEESNASCDESAEVENKDSGGQLAPSPILPAALATPPVAPDSLDATIAHSLLASEFSNAWETTSKNSVPRGAASGSLYVFSAGGTGKILDVSRRYYNANFAAVEAGRGNDLTAFVNELLKRINEKELGRGAHPADEYEAALDTIDSLALSDLAASEPPPQAKEKFKNHPTYVLESLLRKNEVLYPREPVLGLFKGEFIFSRRCVRALLTRRQWEEREGRAVLADARPMREDAKTGALFGEWQTVPLARPALGPGDVIPTTRYGNVSLIGKNRPPVGTVHLNNMPGITYIVRLLNVPWKPALTQFDFSGSRPQPIIDGVVILEKDEGAVRQRYTEYIDARRKQEFEKAQRDALSLWRALFKALLGRYARVVTAPAASSESSTNSRFKNAARDIKAQVEDASKHVSETSN